MGRALTMQRATLFPASITDEQKNSVKNDEEKNSAPYEGTFFSLRDSANEQGVQLGH